MRLAACKQNPVRSECVAPRRPRCNNRPKFASGRQSLQCCRPIQSNRPRRRLKEIHLHTKGSTRARNMISGAFLGHVWVCRCRTCVCGGGGKKARSKITGKVLFTHQSLPRCGRSLGKLQAEACHCSPLLADIPGSRSPCLPPCWGTRRGGLRLQESNNSRYLLSNYFKYTNLSVHY